MKKSTSLRISLLAVATVPLLLLASSSLTHADSVTLPVAPTNLAAIYSTIPNGPEVQLTVTDNASNETEYRLFWHLSGTAWPTTFQTTGSSTWSFPANVGRIQIAAPSTSGTYEYQLQACNSAGCSSSNISLVNVPNTTVPNAPTNLVLDPAPSINTIFLKWSDNSSNEDKFNVDRKFVSDTNYAGTLHWAELPANTTTFSDTNVVAGQHYDYRVQACNSVGCSAYVSLSNVVTSNICTSLAFNLLDNKTTYTVGDNVNYSYKCNPAGTSAPSVTIQVVKPDGTATTYVTGGNVGAVLQQMGFSTSNLLNGSYVLRACLNDTSCGAASVYALPFTVVGGTTPTPTPTIPTPPVTNPNATTGTPNPNATTSSPTTATPTVTPTTITTPATATPTQTPTNPQATTTPTPTQTQPELTALSGLKCTRYLNTVKISLDSTDRYLKNIKQKMKKAPENYVNSDAVSTSIVSADSTISAARDIISKKECSQQTLELIRDRQDDLMNSVENIAGYNKDEIQYFSAYAQCKSTLSNRTKKITSLVKLEKNKDTISSLQDALSEIAQKSQEFALDAANAFFPEVNTSCKEYIKGLDDDVNFYLRTGKF